MTENETFLVEVRRLIGGHYFDDPKFVGEFRLRVVIEIVVGGVIWPETILIHALGEIGGEEFEWAVRLLPDELRRAAGALSMVGVWDELRAGFYAIQPA